jgi:hypothetical protein
MSAAAQIIAQTAALWPPGPALLPADEECRGPAGVVAGLPAAVVNVHAAAPSPSRAPSAAPRPVGSSGAVPSAACFASRRTSRSMTDPRCPTVLTRLNPENSMGNTGQKKPPRVTAIPITVQIMPETGKATSDSSTSLHHSRAPRVPAGARSSHQRVSRPPREHRPVRCQHRDLSTPLLSKRSTAGMPLSPGRCGGFARSDQPVQLASFTSYSNQDTTAERRLRARLPQPALTTTSDGHREGASERIAESGAREMARQKSASPQGRSAQVAASARGRGCCARILAAGRLDVMRGPWDASSHAGGAGEVEWPPALVDAEGQRGCRGHRGSGRVCSLWPVVAAICADGGAPRGGACLCHAERPEGLARPGRTPGRETTPLVRLGICRRNAVLLGGRRDRNAPAARGSGPWPRLDPDRLGFRAHLGHRSSRRRRGIIEQERFVQPSLGK